MSQSAVGNIAGGQPVFGYTELSLSGSTSGASGVLNLASSAAGAGTSSVPCYNMTLVPTIVYTGSGSASLYVGSGTANCTCLLMSGGSNQYPANRTGTPYIISSGSLNITTTYGQDGTIQKNLHLPMVTNTNQLWFKLINSDSGASTATANVEALYTQ